jgi:integrase
MKTPRLPSYRKHSSGQARVTLNGKDKLLGPYGSPESKQEYKKVVAEWLASGKSSSFDVPAKQLLICEMLVQYVKHCKTYYGAHRGSEYYSIKPAIIALKKLYGPTPVVSFGPLQFKAVRDHMAREGNRSRKYVNRLGERIRRIFRWAAGEGLAPASVAADIGMVAPLKAGRCDLRETEGRTPVSEEVVEATLAHLSRTVGDMVRFQLLTGCRPGEVCSLTPGMIDRTNDVWEINLAKHKTAWRGKTRVIYVPKAAQDVLARYLFRSPDECCFSPKEATRERLEQARSERTTPLSCGNKAGTNKKKNPIRTPGDFYRTGTYANAILRGCEKAFPPPEEIEKDAAKVKAWTKAHAWSPNQLRHTFATKIRKEYGLEVASVLLGHSELGVTQIYAEADKAKAIDAVRRLG